MSEEKTSPPTTLRDDRRVSKCVIWDLDNTLWEGILSEDRQVRLRPGVTEVIQTLDSRGILQSIASKNDHDAAMAVLRDVGLAEYFLYPQINWNPKSSSIQSIAKSLNLGLDAMTFVDDQPFELDEVRFAYPQILCIDAAELDGLLSRPELIPHFITEDSRLRRQMYLADIERNRVEAEHVGTPEEFLASLNMRLFIGPAQPGDLERAEELTLRTNQLNTTGYTYSHDELDGFRRSSEHDLLVAALEDKYGSYGKIGLALVSHDGDAHTIRLLLMSCRVMSRGVGTVLLSYIMNKAKAAGVRLLAEFVSTDRNRMMYVTYKFAGFREIGKTERGVLMENDLTTIAPYPSYLQLTIGTGQDA